MMLIRTRAAAGGAGRLQRPHPAAHEEDGLCSGCNSGYLSEDGSNRAFYPRFASETVLRARMFKPSEYEIAR